TAESLPEPLQAQMSELNAVASDAISAFLRAIGESLVNRQPAPSIDDVELVLRQRESAIAEWRKTGFTRELSMDAVGRIFGLHFGLEQMHRNLFDLADRT